MAFAFGWTPCIGPILGSILVLAATEKFKSRYIVAFIIFNGFSNTICIIRLFDTEIFNFLQKFQKNINKVTKIGGAILLITGILIITNHLQMLGYYLLDIFPFLQKFG